MYQRLDYGGLSRSRTSREYHNAVAERVRYSYLLLGRIAYAVSALLALNKAVYIGQRYRRAHSVYLQKLCRYIFLGLVGVRIVYHLLITAKSISELPDFEQSRYSLIGSFHTHSEKPCRCLRELSARQTSVSVLICVLQKHVTDTAHKPVNIVADNTELVRHIVSLLKAYAVYLVAQSIGIFLGNINRSASPFFENADGERSSEILPEKHHNRAHSRLLAEAFGYLKRRFARYSLHLGQPLGVVFDNVKGVLAELFDYPLRRLRTYPLYRARG